jgi:hypothetical protein
MMKIYPTYTLVGNGRVASHLSFYLNAMEIPHKRWHRQQSSPLQPVLECDYLLLAISDNALEAWIDENISPKKCHIIHFSGTITTPKAIGMHPLYSFPPDLQPLDTYHAIPFICDQTSLRFQDIFPSLPNPTYQIPSNLRPYYHALCVMAGNFSVILWQKLFHEFSQKLGIDAQAGHFYMNQIFTSLSKNPETALTGPLHRRDFTAIQRNLDALETDSFKEIYQSFVNVITPSFGDIS